jgi:hypothetical protein
MLMAISLSVLVVLQITLQERDDRTLMSEVAWFFSSLEGDAVPFQ